MNDLLQIKIRYYHCCVPGHIQDFEFSTTSVSAVSTSETVRTVIVTDMKVLEMDQIAIEE